MSVGSLPERRARHAPRLVSATVVALLLVLSVPAFVMPGVAGAGTDDVPERCERAGERAEETDGTVPPRCVGPVTDESGGGGDALTIVIGVVVGLAVAWVAFVLVRRQLAKPAKPGTGSGRPT